MDGTGNRGQVQRAIPYYVGAGVLGGTGGLIAAGSLVAALIVFLSAYIREGRSGVPFSGPRIPREFIYGEGIRNTLKTVSLSLAIGGPGLGLMVGAGAGSLAYRGYVVQHLPIASPDAKS